MLPTSRWPLFSVSLVLFLAQVVPNQSGLADDKRVDAAGDPLPESIRMRMGSTRLWHTYLSGLRFTPDGKQLLSLGGFGEPKQCMLWDVATGKHLDTKPASSFPLAISSDSRWWVSYADGKIHVAAGLAEKPIHTISLDKVESATITRDNKTLTVLTTDDWVYRWDLNTGNELSRHQFALVDPLTCADEPLARISPDGTLLVGVLRRDWSTAKRPLPLRFWNVATGKEARPSLPATDNYFDCRWTADGGQLIVKTRYRSFVIWDLKTSEKLAAWPGSNNYNPVVTPDGRSELISSYEKVAIFDLATGKYGWSQDVAPQVPGIGLKLAVVNRYAFSPDGKTAAVGSNCGRIVFIDWHTGKYVEASTRQFRFYKEG
ncbi:MAG: WD40 repeat domain-containing protein, partial [Planctomycetaceae bacterium]|nr:WD40 repeat domain-containing protein [Planctomycetaceae bacterium]